MYIPDLLQPHIPVLISLSTIYVQNTHSTLLKPEQIKAIGKKIVVVLFKYLLYNIVSGNVSNTGLRNVTEKQGKTKGFPLLWMEYTPNVFTHSGMPINSLHFWLDVMRFLSVTLTVTKINLGFSCSTRKFGLVMSNHFRELNHIIFIRRIMEIDTVNTEEQEQALWTE